MKAYHIGSTAIPEIQSKPVIDILLEVLSLRELDKHTIKLEELGYEAKGDYGIEGRRFFQKGCHVRTHHIHAFETGNPEIKRHALFVAFMNAHPRRLSENRESTAESGFWPIFPIKFVKYNKYSPHLIEKMDSKPLSLVTTSILGQPPSRVTAYEKLKVELACQYKEGPDQYTQGKSAFIKSIDSDAMEWNGNMAIREQVLDL